MTRTSRTTVRSPLPRLAAGLLLSSHLAFFGLALATPTLAQTDEQRINDSLFQQSGGQVGEPLPAPLQPAPATTEELDDTPPRLNVQIPGLNFSDIVVTTRNGQRTVDIPWLAEYIAAAYRYGVFAAGLLASVMFVIGGFQYLTAGESDRIAKAKKRITDAITGLVLLLASYTLLTIVNPQLVTLDALRNIPTVKREPYVYEYSGDTEQPLSAEITVRAPEGIHCPHSGGSDELPKIIRSMQGKVAYRFGGKGGPPPYSELPTRQWYSFNDSCPSGNLCLDCSGFINYALSCAGLPAPGTGTAGIFGSSERVTSFDIGNKTVNNIELKAGDLIGYTASDSSVGVGHVFLYIGAGLVAESSGGTSGRQPGANPVVRPLSAELMKNIKNIKRVQ